MKPSQRILGTVLAMLISLFCIGCMQKNDLQSAANSGSISRVDTLLAQGEDINEVREPHGTALKVAIIRENVPMVQHLLNKGADVNISSPLSSAAWLGNVEIARLLIAKGANVKGGEYDRPPLYEATEQNRGNMVSFLLAEGANPNIGEGLDSPLCIAAFRGYDDIVSMLLKAKADPNRNICLEAAVRRSPSLETTRLLLEHGTDVNARDKLGLTGLHYAAIDGRAEHVRLLLEHGAKPELADPEGKTALYYTRLYRHAHVEEMLSKAKSR